MENEMIASPDSTPDLVEEKEILQMACLVHAFPNLLRSLLKHHENPQERVIAMYSVIATSAVLIQNVYVIYDGKQSYPLLYLLLLLPPANGKSGMALSRKLVRNIAMIYTAKNDANKKKFRQEQAEFNRNQRKGTTAEPPTEPKFQQILISGNITSARLISQLADNGDDCPLLILETEVDALSTMLSSEMGAQNSAMLRQIYHHEAVSSARKTGNETLVAENPKLSLLLSGTENQVKGLFKGNEDGLYSRFTILDLAGSMEWKSPRPGGRNEPIEKVYEEFGRKYERIWSQTKDLKLEVRFTDEQWDRLDQMGVDLQMQAHMSGGSYAVSLARRHILMATKFCTVLTFFRHIDPTTCKVTDFKAALYPTESDFNSSLELAKYSFKKALALFKRMPGSPTITSNNRHQQNFFESLPKEFTKAEANAVANPIKISPRTVDRWLNEFVQTGALDRIARGHYRKSPVALMAVAQDLN
jgi:hypothetical protein